nr:restriction endonuclease subunit S [Qipengyuania aerophila]
MKDSGIEWLGEIPAHWEVRTLKSLVERGVSISYGIVQPGENVEDGVPFIQTTNMSSGNFDLSILQRTTADIASAYPRSTLRPDDVVLGIRASIGAAHIVPEELAGANLSRGVARIQCGEEIYPQYLVACLGSASTERYWQLCKQGSTFNEVSIETVKNLKIAVPPKNEQEKIIQQCQVEQERFADILAAATDLLAVMRERRAALISAAVTGKIDVRGLAKQHEMEAA